VDIGKDHSFDLVYLFICLRGSQHVFVLGLEDHMDDGGAVGLENP
jgi:hypothetical protein